MDRDFCQCCKERVPADHMAMDLFKDEGLSVCYGCLRTIVRLNTKVRRELMRVLHSAEFLKQVKKQMGGE